MSSLAIALICLGAYFAPYPAIMRFTYGRLRARYIDRNGLSDWDYYSTPHMDAKTGGVLAAIVWPVIPLVLAAVYGGRYLSAYMTGSQHLSHTEIENQRKEHARKQEARIRDLERELGMRDS